MLQIQFNVVETEARVTISFHFMTFEKYVDIWHGVPAYILRIHRSLLLHQQLSLLCSLLYVS